MAAAKLLIVMVAMASAWFAHAQTASQRSQVSADFTTLVGGTSLSNLDADVDVSVFDLSGPAFPLLQLDGKVFAAAARIGSGRVVAYGHDTMFSECVPKSATDSSIVTKPFCSLMTNAVRWAGTRPTRVGLPRRVAAYTSDYAMFFKWMMAVSSTNNLTSWDGSFSGAGTSGTFTLTPSDFLDTTTLASPASIPLDFYIVDALAPEWSDPAFAAALYSYVAAGGGLLIGGQCWEYLDSNPGETSKNCPGNAALQAFGMPFTSSTESNSVTVDKTVTLDKITPSLLKVTSVPPATTVSVTEFNNNYKQLAVSAGASKPEPLFMSPLALWGKAFPVLVTPDETTVVAAAESGNGRVVVYGHEALFTAVDKVTATYEQALARNVVRWVARLSVQPPGKLLTVAAADPVIRVRMAS